MSNSLGRDGRKPARLLCPSDSPGKDTGVGCTASSRGSFQPRAQTHSFCITGRFSISEPPRQPIDVTHVHSRILLNLKKNEAVICNNTNATRYHHAQWSESERDKSIWYHLHVESTIWHELIYLQNKNRLSDIENSAVIGKEGRERKREGVSGRLGLADANYYRWGGSASRS